MNKASKIKYVSEVNMIDNNIMAKKPFKISKEHQRRFIRLEISSPVLLENVKDFITNLSSQNIEYNIKGTILNISCGGILIELTEPLNESDIVLLQFTVQEKITLTNVLGLVKRVEKDDDIYLMGIEFISKEYLKDKLSQAEMELIKGKADNFENRVQQVLSDYLFREEQFQ